MANIDIPIPKLQIDFSFAIDQIRNQYLQNALSRTVSKVNLQELDMELSTYVPSDSLKFLAQHGMRGELVFSVPCLLKVNPYLLGYYRLLLGFSKKEFYTTKFGIAGFKIMEEKGILTSKYIDLLPDLCIAINKSAVLLINGIGINRISRALLDDLTLLTVGPQLRGGANVKKGIDGNEDIFQVIKEIVQHNTTFLSSNKIEIKNAADRIVLIEFSPDPDIVIREKYNQNEYQNIVAIEVKGGTDFSNIHNRIGEAEKSHQKAKALGYNNCWTIVNVDGIDMDMARRESPSTNKFYRLSSLKLRRGEEYQDFKNSIILMVSIKN